MFADIHVDEELPDLVDWFTDGSPPDPHVGLDMSAPPPAAVRPILARTFAPPLAPREAAAATLTGASGKQIINNRMLINPLYPTFDNI